MKRESHSRTGLFLMELILVIFFFCLISAICVRIFVNAHLIGQNSVNRNHALVLTQNIAETFYGCQAHFPEIEAMTKGSNQVSSGDTDNYNGSLMFFYDADWQPVAPSGAVYEILLVEKNLPAATVYDDPSLMGNAAQADLFSFKMPLDASGHTIATSDPETISSDSLILSLSADRYLGLPETPADTSSNPDTEEQP